MAVKGQVIRIPDVTDVMGQVLPGKKENVVRRKGDSYCELERKLLEVCSSVL